MENLQTIINNNKGDLVLYRIIFNILSSNNTVKNYTNNNNGILFNMNSFNAEQIQNLLNNVNRFIDNKKEIEKIDDNREKIMKELSKTIDNTTYKTELKNMINSDKKNTLSTQIEIDNTIEKDNEDKKKKNKKIVNSVKKYQKPVIYKGKYDRINSILSKSVRKTKNSSIEEEDRLYDTEQESNISSEEEEKELEVEEDIEVEEIESVVEEDEIKDLFGSDSD